VACKRWLVENAGVSADRVFVLGGSYGGYMALAAATFTTSIQGEGHGFSKNENMLAAYELTDRFLDRYIWGDTSVELPR
jgi:dipeptidyl aminopeptidase/acylaminoacyl peptidase